MSRYSNSSGIVTWRQRQVNGDLIVHLLTPEGQLRAVARRRSRATPPPIDLFQHVAVQIYRRPGEELGLLVQAQLEGALPTLAEPGRYPYAHLLTELADRLFVQGERAEAGYTLYAAALRGIAARPDARWVALVMAFKLLQGAGFLLQLRCSCCGSKEVVALAGLEPRCAACRGGAGLLAEGSREALQAMAAKTVRQLMEAPSQPQAALWRFLELLVLREVGPLRSLQLLPAQ
jgi:DNA repair protein RecO (recombination protein O)